MQGGRSPTVALTPQAGRSRGLRWQDLGFSHELNSYQKENTRSTREKLIKARLGMLALADELQNINRACQRAGICCRRYCETKEAFEKYGVEGLTLRYQRLLWLEQKTAARGGVLTESQLRLLRRYRGRLSDPESVSRRMEAPEPGHLLSHDTSFLGTIKGVGKIYMESVVDAHCSLGFGKPYLSKLPVTAVDVLHDEEHQAELRNAAGNLLRELRS